MGIRVRTDAGSSKTVLRLQDDKTGKQEMKLIGFSGKRGTGKTTASKYLVNGYDYKMVSFASALKDVAESLFPGVGKAAKEKPYKMYDWTPRDFYISLGELGRFYDKNIWVYKVLNSLTKTGKYVIDDVRYANEANLIKSLGGKIIRIERYEKNNPYGKNLDIDSETSLDDYKEFDWVVPAQRNTSLKELTDQVDFFMKENP